jgi:hypothetical protein
VLGVGLQVSAEFNHLGLKLGSSNGKRGLTLKVHAFLVCMDTQDIVVMIFGVKRVIPPTYRKWPQLLIDT